jgi:hypothetical protein
VFTQDATLVSLCLSAYLWARYRRRKGALKLHMLFDHEGMDCTYLIVYLLLLLFIKHQTRYGYSMLELLRIIRERLLGFESLLELLRVNYERLKKRLSFGEQLAFY